MIALLAIPVGFIIGSVYQYAKSREEKVFAVDAGSYAVIGPAETVKKVTAQQQGPKLYVTKPEDIIVPAWVKVGDKMQTVTPLLDKSTKGFAHLNYSTALKVAKANGASLVSRSGVEKRSDLARSSGVELSPITLPDVEMMREAGVDPKDRKAVGALLNDRMRSLEWAKIHDGRVMDQLKAKKWDVKSITSNIGKPWVSGAAPGRGRLFGWRKADGSWIQQERDDHDDQWSDYATTTILEK